MGLRFEPSTVQIQLLSTVNKKGQCITLCWLGWGHVQYISDTFSSKCSHHHKLALIKLHLCSMLPRKNLFLVPNKSYSLSIIIPSIAWCSGTLSIMTMSYPRSLWPLCLCFFNCKVEIVINMPNSIGSK